ncbi:HYC_CC_PP family protein [Zunongwangia sp. HGR-M22]|uniref:HYC_CC_PP family protein n=1 Tax=Zunongwangia sp. HGR-M22 TaxID=3015168 RepID=UPI0022DDB7D1|nr:hypothetical protein [Zunongwangia sp. HGR-M22]WBL26107.1 hypothetical protein PBT91_02165 [Zunongwangia sp. HGR-M22]
MKQFFAKIFASIIAVLVLFSTFSFTVDQHFCGKKLVDSAVFTKAKTCGMEMNSATSAETSITKKSCCTNKKLEVKGQDTLKQNFNNLDFQQQLVITGFVYSYLQLFEFSEPDCIPFKDYSPPKLVCDIQLQDQVFRI